MPKTIKYTGTQRRWPELAITGRQSIWFPGQMDERSDTEAAQLLATGLFIDQSARQLTEDEIARIDGVVSAYGNGTLGGSVLTIAAPDGTSVGDVLTATPSAGWTVASYQWTRDGVDISGQTSSTYTLTLADEGALIGCRAGSPVYTALIEIPAGAYPVGYLSLDGGVLAIDGGVLSLV